MRKTLAFTALISAAAAFAADRPETSAYPYREVVSTPGEYEASTVGTNFVLTGSWDGDVTVTASEACRVTLCDVTISEGVLTISGSAQLWLEGDNSITTTNQSAIVVSDSLTIGGPGTLQATAAGAKKVGVIAAKDLVLAGGRTTLSISGDTKNASGVSLDGNYTQLAGTLAIVSTKSKKSNGVFLAKKKMSATISGGVLDVSLAGEKSVGLALDKSSTSGTMTGGVLRFSMSGDGAKGIKGDGSFTMSGGVVDAEMSGGYAEDLFEYEDESENVWNYYVTLDSSSYTSGNSEAGSSSLKVRTSTMIADGTYAVYDPSKTYAIKAGTLSVSGGLVRIRCTGTCGRGLGADNMYLSGGVYDITVEGGPTDVYVESLVDSDDLDDATFTNVTTCLDAGGAACLKTSGESGVMEITGGTFQLRATGTAGKLINAGGFLVIGAEGSSTLPTDSSFCPDIQGEALGAKTYCTYYKQKYYGSLADAVSTTNIDGVACSVASENIVSGSHDDVDYSNPKGAKAQSGVTVNGGRIRFYTANDGGEGLESKEKMYINGGIIELNCADDCINTGDDLVISNGYIYAASTGNDAIDSNNDIYIEGGYVLAFTTTTPECGIDLDNSTGLYINGGYVFTAGSATEMTYGSSGSQYSYRATSTTITPGTYIGLSGTDTVYAKVPNSSSSSMTCSVMCSVPGTSSSPSLLTSSSVPSGNSVGFHGIYTTGSVSGN